MADRNRGQRQHRDHRRPGDDPALASRLAETIRSVTGAAGYDLEDVKLSPAGRSRILRVLVDSDDGVDLDAVADLSRAISSALDDTDVLGDAPYTLEVSSPGATRQFTQPRHWRRNVGRLVSVTTSESGRRTGRLIAADDDGADLTVDGEPWRVAYADVTKARAELEFNRPKEAT